MNKILKNNIKQKPYKKNDANIKSPINDLLNSSKSSMVPNKNNASHKEPDEMIDVLEDDYKSIFNTTDYIDSTKDFSPNKNKREEKARSLNQIVLTLKYDYSSITSAYKKFQYCNFDTLSDDKRNNILNDLEETVFSKFNSLNMLSKLTSSNLEFKLALQEIFKIEDISNQCAMYAYNIYSFMKMYHYKKNSTRNKSGSSASYVNTNNDSSKKSSFFNKKHFDSIKFARDAEIRRLDNKSSNSLSSTESLNLKMLKQERSNMEGTKSNIRLDNLDKTRTQYLKEEIVNSTRILDGTLSMLNFNCYYIMRDIATKSAYCAENRSKLFQ